jgi:glycosyltransferase involved in cell wall biosynthesis
VNAPTLLPDNPLVSIITVSYNSAKTIEDTIRSVAIQEYPHIEHIIIDGLSTDNTVEIVKSFPHIHRFVSEKDAGIYDAMNKGLDMATGEIIGILNSDDFYISNKVIRNVVNHMVKENTETLYADLIYVHPENTQKVLRTWIAGKYNPRKFLFGWMPPHPTFFVQRQVYKKWGGFYTRLQSAADYELMLRFLYKHNVSTCYLPQVIVKMRSGGNSNSSITRRLRANREDREAWRMNSLVPFFFTTMFKPMRKVYQFFLKNDVPAGSAVAKQ